MSPAHMPDPRRAPTGRRMGPLHRIRREGLTAATLTPRLDAADSDDDENLPHRARDPPLPLTRADSHVTVRPIVTRPDGRVLLVPLRIYLGVIFLVAAWPKLTAEGGHRPRMVGFLENFALDNAHGFYRIFLESVVLPNAGLFAFLVVAGEVLVALALITGTATRLAAGAAMFLTLNYMFAKGMWFWTPASNDAAFFFVGLVLAWGAAGRPFGVDRWLHRRFPTVPLW